MVANILGQMAGFLFFIGVVLFMARLVWSLIPKLIRDGIVFSVKGIYKISSPILSRSKKIGSAVKKDMKPKKSNKGSKKQNKARKSSYKKTKYSHLKIVK